MSMFQAAGIGYSVSLALLGQFRGVYAVNAVALAPRGLERVAIRYGELGQEEQGDHRRRTLLICARAWAGQELAEGRVTVPFLQRARWCEAGAGAG